ncbi:MAG: ABC transporter permease, partial [Candidatus Dormibacteraceae bacterium]
ASQRGAHYLDVIARLKPNVTAGQAQAEMSMIVSALNKQYPENKARGMKVTPELNELVGDVSTPLLVLLAAVGCVLLIACANVANLLLARATTRKKEMAVRAALGASRSRVIRQVLTESMLLASLGGALGVLIAVWGIQLLKHLVPQNIPRIAQIGLDGQVLAFTLILSLLTGVIFGLAPALESSKSSLVESLKEGGREPSGGERHGRLGNFLVAGEVAIALWLLVGAGLLIRSFLRLENVEPGFDPHHVLTFNIGLSAKYNHAQTIDFFQQAVSRIRTLPGVRSASAVVPLPLGGDSVSTSFNVEGQPNVPGHNPDTDYAWVEPGYFRTMNISLQKGRDFTFGDNLKSAPVVIINETMAERFFPGQDPIGKHLDPHIGNGYQKPPMREIVGVVRDVKLHNLNDAPTPQVYVPLSQSPLDIMTFVVNTGTDPQSVVSAVRGQIAELDKDLPLFGTKTLDEYLGESVAQPRFNT